VPFYLAQVLWLYPNATGWQQAFAVVMLLAALVTSANFGLADLSQRYNVEAISKTVIWLWLFYIILLLAYVLADKSFRLMRMKIQARANATFQNDMNATMDSILESLEKSLAREEELRRKYGDPAVEAHLEMLRGIHGKKQPAQANHKVPTPQQPASPTPSNPTNPPPQSP
jgi:hypothetical protein